MSDLHIRFQNVKLFPVSSFTCGGKVRRTNREAKDSFIIISSALRNITNTNHQLGHYTFHDISNIFIIIILFYH